MMLNSRFELSKIEKNTRVEREICLATLENREWKENLFLPLSKIESRKRIVSCHSRKSRVEREMGTIKFSRSREKFLFLLSIFLSRARLLSMPGLHHPHFSITCNPCDRFQQKSIDNCVIRYLFSIMCSQAGSQTKHYAVLGGLEERILRNTSCWDS